ncbi:MAG TPA: H4MPT-linked C1 transfer pathway protein, partial [Planctomycetaceae bacterium]|nr:H4MPT-linked C1 transfer pathway protein [Planctomycetaceae bacterium]
MIPDQHGLLIDIGSTTTDLIPLQQGLPVTEGVTDVERLLSGELVYTGGRRTPLAMLENRVPLRGQSC